MPPSRLVHDPDGLNSGAWPIPAGDFITPVEHFFTRSHALVPVIDPALWRLEVDGFVERPAAWSIAGLTAFPRKTLAATLVCAGLRRIEYLAGGPLPGELPWGPEPASTGRWTGLALADLLEHAGVRPEARFVEFTGLDRVERHGHTFGFGGSIDLEKAVHGDVLLATELNGVPLPPEHGFPLRAVVPGWIAARSVKWLGRITLLDRPSGNYFQSQAYRIQREADPARPRDVSAGIAMSHVPVNAVIVDPAPDQALPAGRIEVRGWAMGSEGRQLARVEVSADDGTTWRQAMIAVQGTSWTWTFWTAELELAPGRHTLVVRATDSAGETQPQRPADTWNVKGYGNNAWHRVTVIAK